MQRFIHVSCAVLLFAGCGRAGDDSARDGVTGGDSPSSVSAEAGWPRFRGPGGMGVAAAADLPMTWSPTENVLWSQRLPGAGTSSPIVSGDRIYLTAYSGYNVPSGDRGSQDDLRRHVTCLDLATGETKWSREVESKLPEQESIRDDHGYASNTPVVDETGVYTFFGKSGVHAFTRDGEPRWSADVGSGLHGWGSAASPVLVGDLVVVNASVESESLVALDKTTGEERWRVRGIKESWNTPVLVSAGDREELVFAIHGWILGLDPASGDELWRCETSIGWYMVPSVVAADGVVYAIGGRSGTATLGVRTGGSGDVTKTHRLWTGTNGSNVSSPIVHDGHLYWMNDKQGIAYCAEAATGEIVYRERVERAGEIYAAPVLVGDRLLYTNRSGRTFVIAAKPEFELLATNDLRDGSLFHASPAIANGRLLIRSNTHLYCIGGE